MEITYRKLGINDAKAYRKIRLESLKAHPGKFGSSYEEQRKLSKLMFEDALEHPVDDRFVIGAFDQDELVGIFGFIPFMPESILALENAGALIQMYVGSTYRGKKVGFNLTTAVINEAFRIPGIEKLVLGVRQDNLSAIRVYEQAGFQSFHSEMTHKQDPNSGFLQMVFEKQHF